MIKRKKYKGCFFSADGYDPKEIASFINKHIFNGKAQGEELQDAYIKTMMWIESKKLPFSESTISSNKEEIRVAINDPEFLEKGEKNKMNLKAAFIIIGLILLIYYFLFEFNENGVIKTEANPAPVTPVAPVPVPVPMPAATPAPAPAVNPVPHATV